MQNIERFAAETVGRDSRYHGARRPTVLTARKTNLCRRENRNSPPKRVIYGNCLEKKIKKISVNAQSFFSPGDDKTTIFKNIKMPNPFEPELLL